MLDIRWIRENAQALDMALKNRGATEASATLIALDEKRRAVASELQEIQNRRNTLSKEIGKIKGQGGDATEQMAEVENLKNTLKEMEEAQRQADEALHTALAAVPNVPEDEVPVGSDEEDNIEVRKWGEPTNLDFEPKAHYDLGEDLGLLDFETAATIAGARFAWQQGDLARLERALASFMLDFLREKGFTEVTPPLLVTTETMFGTGQLPKFQDDQFETTDGRWIIPTSEVPLTNWAQDKMLKEGDLPKRFCAWTPCFRKEAGSAGRDTRGLIRMHQFFKVEMVQLVHPDESEKALQFMTGCAEGILQALQIPHRTIILCTGDIGFGAKKTYDIEVWLPAQNTYREISSCSNCGDFQARRMKARFKDSTGKSRFIHTLNGSGLAVGRTLVAVMENYQKADGSIAIPELIQPYMGGQKTIEVGN